MRVAPSNRVAANAQGARGGRAFSGPARAVSRKSAPFSIPCPDRCRGRRGSSGSLERSPTSVSLRWGSSESTRPGPISSRRVPVRKLEAPPPPLGPKVQLSSPGPLRLRCRSRPWMVMAGASKRPASSGHRCSVRSSRRAKARSPGPNLAGWPMWMSEKTRRGCGARRSAFSAPKLTLRCSCAPKAARTSPSSSPASIPARSRTGAARRVRTTATAPPAIHRRLTLTSGRPGRGG